MARIDSLPKHSSKHQAMTIFKKTPKRGVTVYYLNCMPNWPARVYNSYGRLRAVFKGTESEILSQLEAKGYYKE